MKRALSSYVKKNCSLNMKREIFGFIMSFVLLLMLSGMNENAVYAQANVGNTAPSVSIAEGAEWHYFKGMQKPPRAWNSSGFDDSSWYVGPSGFGYGPNTYGTYLGDMHNSYATVYARYEFAVSNLDRLASMTLSVVCDGPFVAYLNGIAVMRTNTIQISDPGGIPQSEQFDISGFMHELFPRENVLAVECSNDDIQSNDFSFIPAFEVLENKEVQQ